MGSSQQDSSLPGAAVRAILADDHELVREGLAALVGSIEGVEVVAEARCGRQLLELLAAHPADLVLLDLHMPGGSGLAALEEIGQAYPQVRVVVLSMDTRPEVVRHALQLGARGFVPKDGGRGELQAAIGEVMAGRSYVSGTMAGALLAESRMPTARQREVIRLIAEGLSSKEIGRVLGLSAATVDVHRARIMERLGIHDVAGLTRYAVRHGLVEI